MGAAGCHTVSPIDTVTIVPFSVPVKPQIIAEIAVVTQSVTKKSRKKRLAASSKDCTAVETVETVNKIGAGPPEGLSVRLGFSRGGVAQPADLGRQKICAAFFAPGIRRQSEPHLHRSSVRHRRGFFIHGESARRSKLGSKSFTFTKEPSIIEQKAYRDTWGGAGTHLGAYLKWFYETALLLHELLHETGSIYVHIGPNINHLVRAILDEIFQTEIISTK